MSSENIRYKDSHIVHTSNHLAIKWCTSNLFEISRLCLIGFSLQPKQKVSFAVLSQPILRCCPSFDVPADQPASSARNLGSPSGSRGSIVPQRSRPETS